jgi:hypothetical protein
MDSCPMCLERSLGRTSPRFAGFDDDPSSHIVLNRMRRTEERDSIEAAELPKVHGLLLRRIQRKGLTLSRSPSQSA